VALSEVETYSGGADVVVAVDAAMSSGRSSSGWTARILHDITTIVDPLGRDKSDLVRLDDSEGRTRGRSL